MSLRRPIRAKDLPPFDENASCAKCGWGAIRAIYHRTSIEGCPCEFAQVWVMDEHLCRVCERCGGAWCEATVETKAPRRPELRLLGTENGGQS